METITNINEISDNDFYGYQITTTKQQYLWILVHRNLAVKNLVLI